MKRLRFDKTKCLGCMLCAEVCSAVHEGEFCLPKARIHIKTYYDKGASLAYEDRFCIKCGMCVRACPMEAITLDENLTVNPELCIGCGACAEACPKKVIGIIDGRALICDSCGGDPLCVQVCPQKALTYE